MSEKLSENIDSNIFVSVNGELQKLRPLVERLENSKERARQSARWSHEANKQRFCASCMLTINHQYVVSLEEELKSAIEVAIARGEKLGYEDVDYRERLQALEEWIESV